MVVSTTDIIDKFDQVILRECSREKIANWALLQCIEISEQNYFIDNELFELLEYLSSIDVKVQGKYVVSDKDICYFKEAKKKIWKSNFSLSDVFLIFDSLIEGRISRECVDQKAKELVVLLENDMLIIPQNESDVIWECLNFLWGIDLLDSNGEFLHTLLEIKEFKEKLKLAEPI